MFYNKGHQVGNGGDLYHEVAGRWVKVPPDAWSPLDEEREKRLC